MGASMALAGVTACTRQPVEKIVPYVRQPEELIPGKPMFFATAMTVGGVATGLLVESHEGRPTKIEGNALHPGSLGAADVFAQAAILGLYDPDRATTLTDRGEIRPWSSFLGAIRAALTAQQPLKGAGLRILTESVSSPTLAAQIRDVLARYPQAKWHQWDPASGNNARVGSQLAFGEHVDQRFAIERADVILALDSDFLALGPGCVRYARDFASRRRPEDAARMNRLYAIESMPTSTGSRADHRLALPPSEIGAFVWPSPRRSALIRRATSSRGPRRTVGPPVSVVPAGQLVRHRSAETLRTWTGAVARDLLAHRGRCLVVAGDSQPPEVHAIAHAMNRALGNAGSTVVYTRAVEAEPVDQIGVAARSLRGHDRRQGRPTGRRLGESRLQRAGRCRVRRRARQGSAASASGTVRGRDVGTLPLADPRGALPRKPGVTRVRTTARCRSFSRSSRRSMAASPRTNFSPR